MGRRGEGGAFIGGLEANSKRLVATVMNWCEHNLSIRAASRAVAYELEMMQEEVHVCAERHIEQTASTRRSFPGISCDKKLDGFGNFCEATITQVILAFDTTVDRWMAKEILSASGIHLAFDISTFSVVDPPAQRTPAGFVHVTLGLDGLRKDVPAGFIYELPPAMPQLTGAGRLINGQVSMCIEQALHSMQGLGMSHGIDESSIPS